MNTNQLIFTASRTSFSSTVQSEWRWTNTDIPSFTVLSETEILFASVLNSPAGRSRCSFALLAQYLEVDKCTVTLLAFVINPIVSIWAPYAVSLVHKVRVRTRAVSTVPYQWVLANTLLFFGIPKPWRWTGNTIVAIKPCWTLTV